MKTIVALIDFTSVTARIVDQAEKLARAFGSHVVLLHMVPPRPARLAAGFVSPTWTMDPSPEQWQADQARLLQLRDSMTKAGIEATAEQYQEATMEKILEESGRLEADLIIMGSHHHGALYELLVGSVTHDVLKRASCPVLVIPVEESA
jgi:nucleotide-binding universal stress UspA family protein